MPTARLATGLGLLRGSGRDPGPATLAARGVALLLALAAVVASLVLIGRGAFVDTVDAVVVLDDAGGSLVAGADVKYGGVIVGQVTGLERDPSRDTVRIGVQIDPGSAEEVPSDVVARVLPANVFGTSFIDLVGRRPGRGSDLGLSAGQEIRQDKRRDTLEIQTVLDNLDRVVGSLGPARLARTLEGTAAALDGNGDQLGETLVRVERYLERLNPKMPLVRRNLELLATNLEGFERYAPDLLRATDDALVVARTLARRESDFQGLVDSGARTFGATDRLLRQNRRALAETLVRTAVVMDAMYDERFALVRGLLDTIGLADRFAEALSYGSYLRIQGNLVLAGRDKYAREDCPRFGGHPGRGC